MPSQSLPPTSSSPVSRTKVTPGLNTASATLRLPLWRGRTRFRERSGLPAGCDLRHMWARVARGPHPKFGPDRSSRFARIASGQISGNPDLWGQIWGHPPGGFGGCRTFLGSCTFGLRGLLHPETATRGPKSLKEVPLPGLPPGSDPAHVAPRVAKGPQPKFGPDRCSGLAGHREHTDTHTHKHTKTFI